VQNNVIEAGSPGGEETHLAPQKQQLISRRVENVAGHRSSPMIRKGRVRWLAKADALGQALFIAELLSTIA
jgi:hypothetical protein